MFKNICLNPLGYAPLAFNVLQMIALFCQGIYYYSSRVTKIVRLSWSKTNIPLSVTFFLRAKFERQPTDTGLIKHIYIHLHLTLPSLDLNTLKSLAIFARNKWQNHPAVKHKQRSGLGRGLKWSDQDPRSPLLPQ